MKQIILYVLVIYRYIKVILTIRRIPESKPKKKYADEPDYLYKTPVKIILILSYEKFLFYNLWI